MNGTILVCNVGSSSIKFTVFDILQGGRSERLVHGEIESRPGGFTFHVDDEQGSEIVHESIESDVPRPVDHLLKWLSDHAKGRTLLGVGHRIVHGGAEFIQPVCITPEILEKLERLTPFAPLHQTATLAPARAIASYAPDLLQVACFDTAFHQTIPEMARLLPLPRSYEKKGVRRYGFHGLSYTWISSRLKEIDPDLYQGRTIIAHLGSGASLCALKNGKSHETTMGFSALDGLMMGTRSGAIDPGVLLYMIQEEGAGWASMVETLYRQAGLVGVSGVSADMRTLREKLKDETDPETHLHMEQAVSLFSYRIIEEIGALVAIMEGVDGLVFTGGIGEHDAVLRSDVCARLSWLGLTFDEDANQVNGPVISAAGSAIKVRVVPTDEEAVIMREVLSFVTDRSDQTMSAHIRSMS